MLYYVVRPLARLAIKFWFTKIHLVHLDRVPKDEPVIMAINHPTIFIEPCIMACYQPRDLFFLAKGVLFVTPFVNFLKSLHIIPLYRQKDGGFGKRKSNVGTFDYCYRKFDENGAILIMPEGSSEQVRQLRPLTKGFAKMAFGAYERDHDTQLKILPVGVNFSTPDKFRSQVSMGFGEPIAIQDYVELYNKSPREATNQLIDDLYLGMKEQVVHVDNREDFLLADQLLELVENQEVLTLDHVVVEDSNKIRIDKKIAERIGVLTNANKEELKSKTNIYFQELNKLGLTDYDLVHSKKYGMGTLLILIFLHPIFLLGWLTNVIPYGFGLFCGSKANDVETRMSVVMGMAFGFYLFYYPFMLYVGWAFGGWPSFLLALFIPVFGYLAVLYLDVARRYAVAMKVRKSTFSKIQELQENRRLILQYFKS